MTTTAAMTDFVHRRINAMLRRPAGWGPPHAVELQILLLVEMWHVVQGAPKERVDGVMERYDRFLAGVLRPGAPLPLAFRLDDASTDLRFSEILSAFIQAEQQAEQEGDMSMLREMSWAGRLHWWVRLQLVGVLGLAGREGVTLPGLGLTVGEWITADGVTLRAALGMTWAVLRAPHAPDDEHLDAQPGWFRNPRPKPDRSGQCDWYDREGVCCSQRAGHKGRHFAGVFHGAP